MHKPAEREIILIPNTVISQFKISDAELKSTNSKTWLCELGQPEAPPMEDWKPRRSFSNEDRARLERFQRVEVKDVVAGVLSTRIDVAGNLVGTVTVNYEHPKAKAFEKALMKPKCGVTVYPRFGLKHLYYATYTTGIFGFDVGFK